MIKEEEVYKIGVLGKPHGVKGEISFMFDDDIFDRTDADYFILEIEGILVPFFLDEYRFKRDETALVKFVDIDTPDQARELTKCKVYFPRQISDKENDDISWAEIVGYELVDVHINKVVGIIKSVDDSTINILFEISTEDGKELLIPASEELITNVDTEHHQIVMDIPQG